MTGAEVMQPRKWGSWDEKIEGQRSTPKGSSDWGAGTLLGGEKAFWICQMVPVSGGKKHDFAGKMPVLH